MCETKPNEEGGVVFYDDDVPDDIIDKVEITDEMTEAGIRALPNISDWSEVGSLSGVVNYVYAAMVLAREGKVRPRLDKGRSAT